VTAASFAENPELTDAPSKLPASTTKEQKRRNAINSSPAEITQIKFFLFEVKYPPTPLTPTPTGLPLGSWFPRVLAGVLVLARPSAREGRTVGNKTNPNFSSGGPRGISGNPRKPKKAQVNPRQTPGLRGSGSVEQAG